MSKSDQGLRQYDTASEAVRQLYCEMRERQTIDFVRAQRERYAPDLSRAPVNVMTALKSLETYVDVSDPDMDLPNTVHMFQTANAIRADGHPDWMQVVGLIHDMGKCIYLRGRDEDGTTVAYQWSIVGDTFVVGDPLPDTLIYPEFNCLNPDHDAAIYQDGCGLDNVLVAYGHDEYLYQCIIASKHSIPEQGLAMIRYHSLYPWHDRGEYTHLENDHDREMKPWVQLFNKYDLYTKENKECEQDLAYYTELVSRYFPEGIYL